MVDPSGKVAPPTGEVARIGIGVDPPLHSQLPDHPSLDCYSLSEAEQTSGSDT